jgi:hypothetical protein
MKLRLELEENLMIKTATTKTSRIEYSVIINLEISGVRATLCCYCIPEHIRPSYSTLLSRRWPKRVQAISDYKTDIYCIHDTMGNKYAVTSEKKKLENKHWKFVWNRNNLQQSALTKIQLMKLMWDLMDIPIKCLRL